MKKGEFIAPPLSFAMVRPDVFRSGFPTRHNIAYLKRLNLRTIVKLEKHVYPPEVLAWIAEREIRVIECPMEKTLEPFVVPDPAEITKALRLILDEEQHPMLIHDMKGQGHVGERA